jgi:Pyruvate/2-oxoacid:ferredoxin oxidoreductase gamma subunit
MLGAIRPLPFEVLTEILVNLKKVAKSVIRVSYLSTIVNMVSIGFAWRTLGFNHRRHSQLEVLGELAEPVPDHSRETAKSRSANGNSPS